MSFYGPRERMLEWGASGLTDAELLAVLLMSGPRKQGLIPGSLAIANELINEFHSLEGLLDATPLQLRRCYGIGASQSAKILAVKEIAKRIWSQKKQENPIINSAAIAYRLFADIAFEEQEVVAGAFLNPQLKLIHREVIFRGSHDQVFAKPREIVKLALRYNASVIVVAHNHPSGDCDPSLEDETFTTQLRLAAEIVGTNLADHLIVCRGGRYFSFAEAKRLAQAS